MTFLKIIKAIFTKFSAINMTQFAGLATLIISAWQGANVISPAVVIMLTGAITLVLKYWQSTKEMVSSGFTLDWSIWLSGILGVTLGFLDTFVANGQILSTLFGGNTNVAIMIYLALTIILRTGFTNQTPSKV